VTSVQRVLAAGSDGQAIVVGGIYGDVRSFTSLTNTTNVSQLLDLYATQPGGLAMKVISNNGTVIEAQSSTGRALDAFTSSQGVPTIEATGFYTTAVYGVIGETGSAPPAPSKTGVFGFASGGAGIYGAAVSRQLPATPADVGVFGYADLPHASAVYGQTTDTTTETYGVVGRTLGSRGRGVFGWSTAASGGTGVWGQSDGVDGVGIRGYAWDGQGRTGFGTGVMGTSGSHAFPPPAPRANTGVMGVAFGSDSAGVFGTTAKGTGVLGYSGSGNALLGSSTSGTGVSGFSTSGAAMRGSSTAGRGGVFTSRVAQLRLVPATAATHPSSGAKGDLFVDAGGNLWLCKAGTTWVKLG
jgi:hypothetical protein